MTDYIYGSLSDKKYILLPLLLLLWVFLTALNYIYKTFNAIALGCSNSTLNRDLSTLLINIITGFIIAIGFFELCLPMESSSKPGYLLLK